MASDPPDVDEDTLDDVLDAVDNDPDLCTHLKEEGSPTNPTRWWVKSPTQTLRTAEIKACLRWPTTWETGGKDLDQLIWHLLYEHVTEGKDTDTFANELAQACKVELQEYTVAIEIYGLRDPKKVHAIGDFSFGPLQEFLDDRGFEWTDVMDNRLEEDTRDTMVVLLDILAPEPSKARESAYVDAERCLDIIATNHLRSVFNGGPPWVIAVGNQAWCWDSDGDAVQMSFHDSWLTRASFSYSADAAGSTSRPPLEATQQPWVDLPEGELASALRRAYEFFGAAVRGAREPRASLLLAVAGLESVYVPEEDGGGKVARIVAKRLRLAVARDAGTTNPNQIEMLYKLRNRIIHSAEDHQWDAKEARETIGDLYRHLDQLAVFAVENSCSTFADLESHLSDDQDLKDARSWAEEWRTGAATSHKKAEHPDEEEALRLLEAFWGNVKGAIPKPGA